DAGLRKARIREYIAHDEVLEPRVVARSRRQRHLTPHSLRYPLEVAGDIFANDADHLAHNGDADVGVVALADVDQLLCVAANVLVEAEEIKLGFVVTQFLDLENPARVRRIGTERRRTVESQVCGD